MGYASAMAWLLLLVISIFTAILFITSKYWVHYEDGGDEFGAYVANAQDQLAYRHLTDRNCDAVSRIMAVIQLTQAECFDFYGAWLVAQGNNVQQLYKRLVFRQEFQLWRLFGTPPKLA